MHHEHNLLQNIFGAMRYIMKGGVWKNSEDEILKAAIMKYGLNQWSRISSLLQRKSAKQCKQRWYQWLDPSIKKTEWTRSQDEKLLQLARVFPSQWRTIAPFVGRTPTQCFERYEKLLDAAQGKSLKEAEDLRKLRPGEIDPNPQTKPARLDPIDMDEDEKEMLAEVRVRLANTKGKKAKRKQRQKVIEEARRLAQLQKLRELEMAGVDNIPTAKEIKRLRQKKDIDYNREIPFKRDVPEFVYKLEASETPKNVSFASTITLQTLQGKRRDVEEQLQRKLDKRRMKKYRERDLKNMLKLRNDFEKPSFFPIKLPQPQINERDLENMKKYNITTPLNSISNVDSVYGMTPQNKILFSARINMSLNHQEMTPSNEEMDGVEALRYFKQMDKQQQSLKSIDRLISQRMKSPAVGNQWEEDTAKVKGLFKNLRKPENIVQFQIPEEEEEEEDEEVLDVEERERLQAIKAKQLQQLHLQQMSQVLRRGLPRSLVIPAILKPIGATEVQRLIDEQMLCLIYADAIDNPVEDTVFPSTAPKPKEEFQKEELEDARRMVSAEIGGGTVSFSQEVYTEGRKRVKLDFVKKEARVLQKPQNEEERLLAKSYQEYKLNADEYRKELKRSEGNQRKTRKQLAGYEKILKVKLDDINLLQEQLGKMEGERRVLALLQLQERSAMQTRIAELQAYYKLIYNAI